MYFQLHDHCKLVEGKRRGAIYNFQTGKVHSINFPAVELIKQCQRNILEEIFAIDSEQGQNYLQFLDKLVNLELAAYYYHEPRRLAPPTINEVKLEFFWLELTSVCNNKCLHCYATSGPNCQEAKVSHSQWINTIQQAYEAGARAIQLIGGEPLLYPKWRELVLIAHELGYEYIEIFSNATLITDEDVDFLKQYNVNVATTIYADNAEVHDAITQQSGSFTSTLNSIKKVLKAAIPLRIASIIMKPNENQVENIMNLCRDLGVEVNPPDVIRPTGRGDDELLKPDNYTKPPVKPPFYTDAQSFFKAQHYHSCLAGKLAVTADGDVIPCIFARDQICGNILKDSLLTILQGQKLQDYWHTTKDGISKCCDCEYRYACHDCRPLAQGSNPTKNWLACTAGCSYDPNTGIWEEK